MSYNSFGKLFRFTTWGESHGDAIGCIVDGVPSGISLSEEDIQIYMDQRKPGTSKFVTQRREDDRVCILSGVLEGVTTGHPISMIVHNQDQRSKDYSKIKDKFRPGHADYTYRIKYGIRDYRGGGRASARETAMRVAAGAIARKLIPDIEIKGAVLSIGEHVATKIDFDFARTNSLWCPDRESLSIWENALMQIRSERDSIGATIEIRAFNVPVGFGEPKYQALDANIACAMMSINAVKAVEIGAGVKSSRMRGSEFLDRMTSKEGDIEFQSNNAGGILGGLSSGDEIISRFSVKPTSSIAQPLETVDIYGCKTNIETIGRHDPCVGIRAVPIGEAMLACVLADAYLMNRAHGN